ncbi:hypothetical protein [Haloplasma contractile]|uniref:Uncharacterized protein n=1 Tax=Haloplasma contractile SSD-17B TaxID=1033810 RepID=U2EF74_9MOLU|nr:hypothetical protein [Haloplasma contractile]ERJ13331.1 hypothetical protein HLPCO_000960 [Haloplasma contractile SSD-17B]
MANLDDLKNIIDEHLNEISVTEELKQKTLMKCKNKEQSKKNWFRLPYSIKKPMIALTCGVVIILALTNYNSMLGTESTMEKNPYSDKLNGRNDEYLQYKYDKPDTDGENPGLSDEAEETTDSTEDDTEETTDSTEEETTDNNGSENE